MSLARGVQGMWDLDQVGMLCRAPREGECIQMKLVFSVPAYIGAIMAGSCTMAACTAIAMLRDVDTQNAPAMFLVTSLFGGVVAALPALVFFLPATLLSFWLANRLQWKSPLYFGLSGAISAAGTAGIFLFSLPRQFGSLHSFTAIAACAFAGAVAALTYRWLDLLSRRKQEIAN